MATNNVLNAPLPLSATQGGLGVASPTAHGVLIGEGASAVTPIVLSAGQLLIGTTSGDPTGAVLTQGTGITITSASGSVTIANSAAGAVSWNAVSGTTQAMAVNQGYFANNVGQTTFTLPATAALGSVLEVVATTAAGWTIVENTGQSIVYGDTATTTTSGSLTTTSVGDTVRLVCSVANTTFTVLGSVGNLTVV